jgi:hypothetical protein
MQVSIQTAIIAHHDIAAIELNNFILIAQKNQTCPLSFDEAMSRGNSYKAQNPLLASSFFKCAVTKKHKDLPRAQKALSDVTARINQAKLEVKQTGRGAPTNAKSGAPQSGQCIGGKENLDFLQALIPSGRVSLTSLSDPSLLIFFPEVVPPTMTLKITGTDRKIVSKMKTPKGAGIFALKLSELPNWQPLATNVPYKWQLELNCELQDALGRPSQPTSDGNPMLQGYIERINPDPMASSLLRDTPKVGHIGIFLQAGIWYDTLSLLFETQVEETEDMILKKVWADVLSEPIFTPIVNQPLKPFSIRESILPKSNVEK